MTTLSRVALTDALAAVAPAIPTRPSLPILTAVELRLSPGSLTVRATDYDTTIWRTIAVETDETATLHVSGHRLKAVVSALSAHDVHLTVDAGLVTVKSGGATYRMMRMASEEFPAPPSLPEQSGVVDAEAFADALRRIKHASGGDELESVRGMSLAAASGVLTLSSTDRFALAQVEVDYKGDDFSARVLYPDLLTAVRGASGDVDLHVGHSNLAIVSATGGVMFRLLDGQYPNLGAAIAKAGGGARFTCDREALHGAAKRAALVIERNGSVACQVREDGLHLSSRDEVSDLDEVVEVTDAEGAADFLINPDYLAALLEGIDTPQVELDTPLTNGALRATGLDGTERAPHLHVLMTMRSAKESRR